MREFVGDLGGAFRGMFHVTSAARSHPGLKRGLNEDAVFLSDDAGIWAVADGMGGHDGGEHASRLVVGHLGAIRSHADAHYMLRQLRDAIHAAHEQLRDEARARSVGTIGSTVVALMEMAGHCVFAWVGDSRGYLYDQGALARTTRDHSLVQDMVDAGELTPEEADAHPSSHVLTRAVGANESIEVDFRQVTLSRGNRCVLCSDGLTCCVTEEAIATTVRRFHRPGPICDALLRQALDAGAPDNVSVVVVAFD